METVFLLPQTFVVIFFLKSRKSDHILLDSKLILLLCEMRVMMKAYSLSWILSYTFIFRKLVIFMK